MIILVVVIYTMIVAKSIILPFVIAMLIWFVVKKTRDLIDKIGFVKRYIPRWIKSGIATLLIFGLLILIGQMLTSNIEKIVGEYPTYQKNLEDISKQISSFLKTMNIDMEKEINTFLNDFDFTRYLTGLFNSISDILGSSMMVLFYAIFIFAEESLFQTKSRLLFSEESKYLRFETTTSKIDKMLSDYISLKSLVSFITAVGAYIVFWAVGLDSPFFWAAIVFIFNFIPSIGSIFGTVVPAFFALIQFGDWVNFSIILGVVGTVQVVVGNVVEPRLMGNTLNISPLVTILALTVWGAIWDITGMLLSVPITVALIIIMSQFQSTRSVAILLSEKGKV